MTIQNLSRKNKFQPLVKHEYNFFKSRCAPKCVFRDGEQRWGAGLEENCERLGPNTVENDKIVWN